MHLVHKVSVNSFSPQDSKCHEKEQIIEKQSLCSPEVYILL